MISESEWKSIFNPESIAVIGASNNPGSWGGRLMRNLSLPNNRPVYPVHPTAPEIMGKKAYKSILDIPEPVDMAAIVVRAELVPEAFNDAIKKGINGALIVSGGFRETDEEGAKREAEIVKAAQEAGIHFIGPNTMGHLDTYAGLNTLSFAENLAPGKVALIAQSGNMGTRIIQAANRYGFGFSRFVCCGNEASIAVDDYLEYFASEPHTEVICLYIEGLRNARRFMEVARKITPHKPIVVLKSGGTAQAARASRSHVGAMAGSDDIYTAAFKQAGVIRVQDDDELCDVTIALLNQPLPKGKRVGILTMGGGLGVVATEACERAGLEIGELEQDTIDKLSELLPARWSHANPVDLVGSDVAHSPEIIKTLWILLQDKNLDAVISNAWLGRTTHLGRPGEISLQATIPQETLDEETKSAEAFNKQAAQYGIPLCMVGGYPGSALDIANYAIHHKAGSLVYPQPQRAAKVLKHLVWYREYLDSISK